MPYFAEIIDNEVVRVIVADTIAWCEIRLGGTWIETQLDAPEERYAGPGMKLDAEHPAKFAVEWQQPVGSQDAYPVGMYVWHEGRIYQSTTPNNVWAPTVFGWRDKTDPVPQWRQPLGAGDVWNLGDEVLHRRKHWRSLIANNVWEPGAGGSGSLWEDITATAPPDEEVIPDWVQPTGAHDAYAVGARVRFNGQVWENTSPANVFQPGVFGWVIV